MPALFVSTPRGITLPPGTNTTQFATTEFVANAIAALISSAPGFLDTFDEIAAAIGDDPNFATTIMNQIGLRVLQSDYNTFVAKAVVRDAADSVGIGAAAHASAILDVNSTTKGLLFPRMSTTQREAIASPAQGLVVFDTTVGSLYYYNGGWKWYQGEFDTRYLQKTGGALSGGLSFGSAVSPGEDPYNLSRHLALWGSIYGFSVTGGTLNAVANGGGGEFHIRAASLKRDGNTIWDAANFNPASKLNTTDKATDSALLNGRVNSSANNGGTIAQRDDSGDVTSRLFRTEYSDDGSTPPNFFVTLGEVGVGVNNYMRPTGFNRVKNALLATQYVDDWNNAVQNGVYMYAGAANAPTAVSWYMGYVEAHNTDWVTQTVHGFTDDGAADTVMYRRNRNNGTWGTWYRLRISEQELDTRYKATMTGATASAAGTSGLVPAPTAGQQALFLAGNGTWKAAGASVVYTERAANTQIIAADNSKLIYCTGTFTQTFASVTTLGSGFYLFLCNNGTGDITLDPNASETIDGMTSFIMYPGEVRLIQCDGAVLRSVVLHGFTKAFVASGTFVKPPGYIRFDGQVNAGGGGGYTNAGGGGGGGGLPFSVKASALAASTTVNVGSGGTGGTTPSAGGGSFFGTIAIAAGGGPGNSSYGGNGGGVQTTTAGTTGFTTNPGQQTFPLEGGFGAGNVGGSMPFGGGGGSATNSGGGKSIYGGGGGAPSNPGTSVNAGNGSTTGSAGIIPGGGGGPGAAGGRGEVTVRGIT